MPAAVAVPLITGAIGAGTAVYGAKKASDTAKQAAATQAAAAEKASQVQQQATNQALSFLQNESNTTRAQQEPYRQFGLSAMNQLGQLTGIQMPQQQQAPPMSMAGQMGGGRQMGGPMPKYGYGAPPTQGDMVTIQAPTGETRQMPRSQAQSFISRGAKVVG